jgi:dipeptidyl aminopeptidase/acylaminoacyl peptidase
MKKHFTKVVLMISLMSSLSFTSASQPLPAASAQTPKLIPLRDFFKNSLQDNYQVSPNATHIAFLQPWNNRLNIFIQKLSSEHFPIGLPIQVSFVADRDIRNYLWKNEDTIVYSKDFGGDENYHLFAVNLKHKTQQDLTPHAKIQASIVDDLTYTSDTDLLIQHNLRNPEIFDVYRLNTQTGQSTLVAKNPGKVDRWLSDHDGVVRIAVATDGLTTKIYTRSTDQDKFKPIVEFGYKDAFEPLLFSADNQSLYVSSNLKRDKKALIKADLKSGKELEMIYQHPAVDVESLGYSNKRKTLTSASFVSWKIEHEFFDPIVKSMFANIKEKVGDKQIFINSSNKDESIFTVIINDDKSVNQYYLYNLTNNTLTLLANSKPWLKPEQLASMKPIEYKSRDGLTIHGYLTLPTNGPTSNLPVIVHPHGGPWARDVWGYNPEVQFLANRGYAVFQMNFRGSTGYGKKFIAKSFKQWGNAMQNDITDGVNWLIKEKIADPKRIAIYGASYGGYATLAGITFTPDLYACAIDYVGVANLFTFLETIPPYWKNALTQLHAMVGDPIKDKKLLTQYSPVFHVDKIKTPLFVAQGAKDPRVKISEADQIVDKLKARGVKVQYMVKENEGHGFYNEENRFEFYEAMEQFLSTHLNNTTAE